MGGVVKPKTNIMRENIFTMFARSIQMFCEHKITKEDLFNHFVGAVECADENERNERENHKKALKEWGEGDLSKMIKSERPYSNLEKAIEMLR